MSTETGAFSCKLKMIANSSWPAPHNLFAERNFYMIERRLKGIYAVPAIPYELDFSIDIVGFSRVVEFCLNAGVAGIVVPGTFSEEYQLTENEFQRVLKVAIETVAGRIPVIAGVSDTSFVAAGQKAAYAAEQGASMVLAWLPNLGKNDEQDRLRYYTEIARPGLPIIVHNRLLPSSSPMDVVALAQLRESVNGIRYVLEEGRFHLESISDLCKTGVFDGVLAGDDGLMMCEEYARGSCGNIIGAALADIMVQVFTLLGAGRKEEAIAIHQRLVPILYYEKCYPGILDRAVLEKRGILKNRIMRTSWGNYFDSVNEKELERLLCEISDLLRMNQ
jgi:dihydrodipicolinate synthase/N-acetylneuraminate lyase